ncbi:MAG: alcohol dehydrogenase catalytic domain-containing protein [Thermodesulfobacteriota bacterium]|nr:alcohol dehydrogenase catalytic domain-containing protein [Thermodesulfobacteriota bacterium]
MKAVVYYRSKGLVVEDVPMPGLEAGEVLVKVIKVGFCGSDHSLIESGSLKDGTILGHEVSGIVMENNKQATGLKPGSRVIIRPTFCGRCKDCRAGRPYLCQINRRSIGIGDMQGGFAEYVKVYPQMLIPIPEGVDLENAALAEPFAAALHGIRCSDRKAGSALIIGGGAIGLALAMLLKILGSGPIAVSEPVKEKRDLAKNLGADIVIDPSKEDIVGRVLDETKGLGFDVVFECSGSQRSIQTGIDTAARGGTVCVVSIIMTETSIIPLTLNFKEIWLTGSYSNTHEENIKCLDWMAKGKLDARPLITDRIELEELSFVYEKRVKAGKTIKVMADVGKDYGTVQG